MSIMHEDSLCTIIFGDAEQAFIPYRYKGFSVLQKPPFNRLAPSMGLKQLVFLHQTHSTQGRVVYEHDVHDVLPSFVHEGDFLISNVPQVGLGIATADCLPIIMVDTHNKAVGIAHAGWRGSVAGVGNNLFIRMKELFKTQPDQITVYFGPSAKACCYEVQEGFKENIRLAPHASQAFVERSGAYYFDLGVFNQAQLELEGIPASAIKRTFHACTMCTPGYCSFRRFKNEERHMTVVALK